MNRSTDTDETPTADVTPTPRSLRRRPKTAAPPAASERSTGNDRGKEPAGRDGDPTAPPRSPEPTHFITLRSFEAQKLWLGRTPAEGRYRILGCVDFSTFVKQITDVAVQHDDPYADVQLLRIESALAALEAHVGELSSYLKGLLQEDEDSGLEYNGPFVKAFQPERYPVLFASGYGYKAARVLGRFDSVIVDSITARNCALLPDLDWRRTVPETSKRFRAFFELARGYRFSGASRDDFAANTERARAAIAKYGPVPEDVLNGVVRPALLPARERTA